MCDIENAKWNAFPIETISQKYYHYFYLNKRFYLKNKSFFSAITVGQYKRSFHFIYFSQIPQKTMNSIQYNNNSLFRRQEKQKQWNEYMN